jgi:hypothetical protein
MKKPELDSLLRRARLPEPSEESLEMLPRRIVARLKRNDLPPRRAQKFLAAIGWAFGLVICVILVIILNHRPAQKEAIPSKDVLANAKVIRETLAMFPNRVRAIVEDERGTSLILSQTDDIPASTPLYVHICDGQHCSSFVTFSGQEIQVAGQKMTALSEADGGIILTGNQFVWSNNGRTYANNHLKIEAKNLGAAAL